MSVSRLCLGLGVLAALLAPALAATSAPIPPSAKDLTRAPLISDVSVSPDGKHLVALTSPDGETVSVSVWRTDQPGAPPKTFGSGSAKMRFIDVRFLKDDRLLVSGVEPFDCPDVGCETPRTHLIASLVSDLDGASFAPLLPTQHAGEQRDDWPRQGAIISLLRADPRHVLVEDRTYGDGGDIYRVDVYSMAAERVMRGSDRYGDYKADLKGELRARETSDFDNGRVYIAEQIRNPDTGVWEEHFRSYAKDRDVTQIIGFTTDPNVVLITNSQGADKTGVYEYDIKQRKIIEPAFQHKLFDAAPYVLQSMAPADYGRILGFGYQAETSKTYWLDDRLAAIFKALAQPLGAKTVPIDWTDPGTVLTASIDVADGAAIRLVGASNDMKFMVIETSGPKQPPEYYLLTDGAKLSLLGKAEPWIDRQALGDTRLVEYPARDGLLIPAFLTTPPKSFGPGPYPTLIEPHGGPWARDEMGWDVTGWVQYFASRGFAVLQPQFRGSEGWGQKLWRAGDGEWGQTMQDDKDDGVKWLISQKIADPRRVAMFGYSYGGYAALAASIRPNGLYQCAISGAGAGDLEEISEATSDNRWEREFQHPTIKGLDALAHAREAQIPVLLYHGDRDATVNVEQSRKFAAVLKSAGKPYRYVEIKDMGHQLTYWTPDMALEQLTIVDDFLKTGCKPGGL